MSIKVNFIGRLGADAETVTTGNTKFISCSVAVDDNYRGERVTRWIKVSADYERFKNMVQYLTKGKALDIMGVYRDSMYESNGKSGIDRTVSATFMEFVNLGGPKQDGDNNNGNTTESKVEDKNAQMTTGTVKTKTKAPVVEDTSDSDLPF